MFFCGYTDGMVRPLKPADERKELGRGSDLLGTHRMGMSDPEEGVGQRDAFQEHVDRDTAGIEDDEEGERQPEPPREEAEDLPRLRE